MYTVTPAGAGGFKIRQEDGKGNIGAYEPGIFATEVEARAHIVELTTPKTKTQTAAEKKATDKAEADAAKELADKEAADKALADKEQADKDAAEKAAADEAAKTQTVAEKKAGK